MIVFNNEIEFKLENKDDLQEWITQTIENENILLKFFPNLLGIDLKNISYDHSIIIHEQKLFIYYSNMII